MDHLDTTVYKTDGAATYTCTQACHFAKNIHTFIMDKDGNQKFRGNVGSGVFFRSAAGEGKDSGDGAGGVVAQTRNRALQRGFESNNAEQLVSVLLAMGMPGTPLYTEVDRSHDVTRIEDNKVLTIPGIGNHVHWQVEEAGVRVHKASGIGRGWLITNAVLDGVYPKVIQQAPSWSVSIPQSLTKKSTSMEAKLQGSSVRDLNARQFTLSTTHTFSSPSSTNASNSLSLNNLRKRSNSDNLSSSTESPLLKPATRPLSQLLATSIPVITNQFSTSSTMNDIESLDVLLPTQNNYLTQCSGLLPENKGSNSTKKVHAAKKARATKYEKKASHLELEARSKENRSSLTQTTRESLGLVDIYCCQIEGCTKSFITESNRQKHENKCTGPPELNMKLPQAFEQGLRNEMLTGSSSTDSSIFIQEHTRTPIDWIVTIPSTE